MHIIQEEIGLPKITESKMGDFHSTFMVSPLPAGYGTTLGNGLRRVLLSSLPGAAVTGIKVKGVTHEYTVVKGAKDSILDIMLNLKQLAVSKETKETSIVHLKVKKGGVVTAADIDVPSDITIHNPDLYITTLEEKNAGLDMEIRIEKGIGYRPAQIGQKTDNDAEMIEIDAVFTPVQKIHYSVEAVRVGQRTDLDKMTLEVKTNGSILPKDAMRFAANVLESYFNIFNRDQKAVEPEFMSDFEKIAAKAQEEESSKPRQESYTPIEILGLSPRTLNSLINGDIGSIEQLTKCTHSKLSNLRGFGKKALTEVEDALEKRGLTLTKDE